MASRGKFSFIQLFSPNFEPQFKIHMKTIFQIRIITIIITIGPIAIIILAAKKRTILLKLHIINIIKFNKNKHYK